MKQTDFFKSRKFIVLLGIILVTVIGGGVIYFTNAGKEGTERVITPEATAVSSPSIISSVTQSPVSPLSPLSPILSSTPAEAIQEEIEAQIKLGMTLYESQNYQEALRILNDALTLAPDSFLAHNVRGSVYVETGEYQKAVEDFSKAIDLEPLFPHAYYNRGRVYRFTEQYEEAITDLTKSIELSQDEFGYRANGNIGLIYHQMGEYNKALEAFEKSISYNEDERADVYYFRGETYSAMGNYEAAIADYQAAIERFSNYGQAYQGLGYAYFKTDRLNEAVEALNQALQISPNPVPHLYFTLVYLALEDFDQAQAQATQAAESIDQLPQEEQNRILVGVLADLETFRENHPNRAEEVNTIIALLPAP